MVHTIFYHYLYVDVYIPVWPNIVASIIVGAWVIWRNRTHIDKLEHRMMHRLALHTSLVGREMEKIHGRISTLHTSGSDHSGDSNSDPALFAHQEVERTGTDPS